MEKKMVVQRIINKAESPLETAVRYYSILSVLNSLKLTVRENQLLAFIATNGGISYGGAKELFGQLFGSSKASIANMVHRMTKKGVLIKKGGKIQLHPQIHLDFNNDVIVLNITMTNGQQAV